MDASAPFRRRLLAAIPRLRRYARSIAHDPQAADDLVQTALERALLRWQQFDARRDIVVWLIGIAHNAHLDEHRRNGRLMLVDLLGVLAEAVAARSDPGVDIGLRIDIVAALQRLPIEQRAVVLLVGVEQFSYAECAEALAIPIGTVMSRLSRGRAALRALLDGTRPVAAAPSRLRRVV
jgi:RNA polymerase sigma-70 factor (ECF subfamily)